MRALRIGVVAGLMGISACGTTPKPEPIVASLDQCEYCRMQISDPRFGGELLTSHGRLLKFDAIECLRDYYRSASASGVRAGWVLDIRHPGEFVSLDSARFIRATSFHSPMGRGLVATRSDSDAESVVKEIGGGQIVRWSALQKIWLSELRPEVRSAEGRSNQ